MRVNGGEEGRGGGAVRTFGNAFADGEAGGGGARGLPPKKGHQRAWQGPALCGVRRGPQRRGEKRQPSLPHQPLRTPPRQSQGPQHANWHSPTKNGTRRRRKRRIGEEVDGRGRGRRRENGRRWMEGE